MTPKQTRKIRGFCCDHCGQQMTPGHELVLEDLKWIEIVGRSKSPYEPKCTLLCPECIELLNGRPLKVKDLLHYWHRGDGSLVLGAVPMNIWYMREHGLMEEAKPYILNHIRLRPSARKAWSDHGVTEEEVR